MAVTVADVLALPLLEAGNVVAGHEAVDQRTVRWIAVIEWPVESFVSAGELVLTSGVGCEGDMFERLCREIMSSDAAALFVGVGSGRFVEHVPAAVCEVADSRGVPVVQIPWDLRFAEIIRATVDLILSDQYEAMDRAEHIHDRFTSLIADGKGLQAVADSLEEVVSGDVLVFDSEFQLSSIGRGAAQGMESSTLTELKRLSTGLDQAQLVELRRLFEGNSPTPIPGLAGLGIGPGVGLPVTSNERHLAYVYVLNQPENEDGSVCMPGLEARAIEHAAAAVALAVLRNRAIVEAEARAQGDFLWALAWGLQTKGMDISEKAEALGYDPRGRYWVALAETQEASTPRPWPAEVNGFLDKTQREIRFVGQELAVDIVTARHDRFVLVLVPSRNDDRTSLRDVVELIHARQDLAIGIAREPVNLQQLRNAYQEARRCLEIGQLVLGERCIADSRALMPFLMLDKLKDDDAALATARSALEPLLAYQKGSERPLLETLKMYLDENCNASAAARRLYLNRHSLLYRLNKIEELTGYDLDSRDDRFILELSLRLLDFGVVSA